MLNQKKCEFELETVNCEYDCGDLFNGYYPIPHPTPALAGIGLAGMNVLKGVLSVNGNEYGFEYDIWIEYGVCVILFFFQQFLFVVLLAPRERLSL